MHFTLRRWLLPIAVVMAMGGCNRVRGAPTGRTGWLGYRLGEMALDLPEEWGARGDGRHLSAESPDGRAHVMAELAAGPFSAEAECLARAEQSLARGAVELERSRRHPTRLGGRSAVVQEADQRGWHGWAWAVCDRGRQYRISFFAVSPMTPEAFAAQRGIEAAVRFDGAP